MEINTSISLLSQIHSMAADFLILRLKERGLPDFSSSHGNILFQLCKNGRMTMGGLARSINRDKSTATVLVRKLESAGLVVALADEADRRSRILCLTEKGTQYTQALEDISRELIATFYKDFSDDERRCFFGFLERIEANFCDRMIAGGHGKKIR